MIPKVIHYCWFGESEKPKKVIKCIQSWKKYCPDYEIIEWNEGNFDITSNKYVFEAYENKKYAFVTDYVRLLAIYKYGGIYMDTDVQVISSLDKFLSNKAFLGFESKKDVSTCIMASEKNSLVFDKFLSYYEKKVFIKNDGSLDLTTNVKVITKILSNFGLKKNGEFQIIEGLTIYPPEYFCPLDDATGRLEKTENTTTIHWFNKSWIEPKKRLRSKITKVFRRIFGRNFFNGIKKVIEK